MIQSMVTLRALKKIRKKIFNTAWTDLNDRQREYLRKYNYPETWSEFTEHYGFKVVNDIRRKITSCCHMRTNTQIVSEKLGMISL